MLITINVLVVYLARYVMVLRRARFPWKGGKGDFRRKVFWNGNFLGVGMKGFEDGGQECRGDGKEVNLVWEGKQVLYLVE
jgi:hypothetical protein